MKYKLTRLRNSLRLIVVPMPTLESVTVTVWVGVGSRYEAKMVSGLSHFLEHMVFKGSKKRPSAKKISEAIDSFGGEFNASTSKEWTNFYIKARAAKLSTAMDVLSDMVLAPLLKPEDIEREKGVILEEMAMYEDTPIAKIEDYFERLIFKGNSLGRDIVGDQDSVKSIGQRDFIDYRDKNYSPENIVITIAGGVSFKKASELTKRYFSAIKVRPKANYRKFVYGKVCPKVLLKSKKIEQAHLVLGFFGNPRKHKLRYAEALLSTILGGGMSSRMFTEVREKRGLAYAVKTSSEHFVDCGYLATYAGVDLKRIDEAIKVILEQYFGLTQGRFPISKKEFKKAKEFVKGHLALALEDTNDVNGFFGIRELLDKEIETPDEVYKKIDKVEVDEVVSVAKSLFVPRKLNLAIIGPYKESAHFESLLA